MYTSGEPNLLIALGFVALTLAINVPLLHLARHWYREKSPAPIAKHAAVFPALYIGCAVFAFFILLFAVYGYMTEVTGVNVVALIIIGPVVTTFLTFLACLAGWYRILMYDDRLVIGRRLNKGKVIYLKDIDRAKIVLEGSIELFSSKRRVLKATHCKGFYTLQRWAERGYFEIEYHDLPDSVDPKRMYNS